jgi:hypothetical protein
MLKLADAFRCRKVAVGVHRRCCFASGAYLFGANPKFYSHNSNAMVLELSDAWAHRQLEKSQELIGIFQESQKLLPTVSLLTRSNALSLDHQFTTSRLAVRFMFYKPSGQQRKCISFRLGSLSICWFKRWPP